ncbi:hypothetical protein [Actinomadura miaoliensis]|uniref:hypothetical protein n=1 Tax=Actinomadura miaoliensis TaxID=430685 RepID=UPI0031F1C1BE
MKEFVIVPELEELRRASAEPMAGVQAENKDADPAEFTEAAPRTRKGAPSVSSGPAVDASSRGVGGLQGRWTLIVAGGVFLVTVGSAISAVFSSVPGRPAAESAPSSRVAPRPSAPLVKPAQGGAFSPAMPAPSPGRCAAVLTEVTSGDPDRVADVTERSRFDAGERRLYAATYTGWVKAGLGIRQSRPIGEPSGLRATQVWELRDGAAVLAVSHVTWHRADGGSPWRLTEWPSFQPVK